MLLTKEHIWTDNCHKTIIINFTSDPDFEQYTPYIPDQWMSLKWGFHPLFIGNSPTLKVFQ